MKMGKIRINWIPTPILGLIIALVPLIFTAAVDESQKDLPSSHAFAGIENVWRMDTSLLSGGDPNSESGLKLLKSKGIKTIISVDGATPPVEIARRMGLRYVHIPVGYDGIPIKQQIALAQAFAQMPKPIYVHCHHGRHRGPAAASIMAQFGLGWSKDQAIEFMRKAGTSKDYSGLYDSVNQFQVPDKKAISAIKTPLPESVEMPALVDMMVQIDQRFDRLKAWLGNDLDRKGKTMAGDASKIDPLHDAIQLRELVRESSRLPECRDQPAEFSSQMGKLESDLTQWLERIKPRTPTDALETDATTDLKAILNSMTTRCATCHRSFRDKPLKKREPSS